LISIVGASEAVGRLRGSEGSRSDVGPKVNSAGSTTRIRQDKTIHERKGEGLWNYLMLIAKAEKLVANNKLSDQQEAFQIQNIQAE
jgi:hypothetical protein